MRHTPIVNYAIVVIIAALITFLITIRFFTDQQNQPILDAASTDQHTLESYQQIQKFRAFIQEKSTTLKQFQTNRAVDNSSITWGHWNREQLECLAANIYHESRGEPIEGQVAVAAVTLNRVHDSRWPSTICEVVQQKTQVAIKDQQGEILEHRPVCQFSWMCDSAVSQNRSGPAWRGSMKLANSVVQGKHDHLAIDYQSALYFHKVQVKPNWANNTKIIKQIGAHVFRGDV